MRLDITDHNIMGPDGMWTHFTALSGMPRRLEMAGALIPVPLRAITFQRCPNAVRYGHLYGNINTNTCAEKSYKTTSELKSNILENPIFREIWTFNTPIDFTDIYIHAYQNFYFEYTYM